MLAGVRIGLLSALLLGPVAAAGLGLRMPGLVSGVRDALVLALYLGVLFFLASALLSAGVSLGASAFVRAGGERFATRARRASQAAAWSSTIACLVYLTFWWRAASTAFAWSAPLWTAFALAVAAIVSLLLGHAVRITTLAVLRERRRLRRCRPCRRRRGVSCSSAARWRFSAAPRCSS